MLKTSFAIVTAVLVMAALSASAQKSLTGAGATFPAPIYQKWFSAYQSVDPGIQINYQPIGSGGGIKNVTEGVVDFGASDGPMTDAQIKAFRDKRGFNILHFPTVLGAAVPTYNIPGVTQQLNFTPEALSGIFLGTVKKWNDPAIASANPGVKLPGDQIVVVHRSDGSGTTYCWTDYLSKVSAEWKSKAGTNTSVNWPAGIGGKGNDGVAGLIKQQKGALGYVELIYAVKNHLSYGKVKNRAGEFIKPDLQSVTAAAEAAASTMPADFRVSITDPSAKGAYPISTFTWLLIPERIPDAAREKALVGFLKWAITKGQDSVESLEYAKLPAQVMAKEEKAIALIK
ncbi:MAG: phosphate ABC transporter substrate-binding protein PstS [Bryobacteraceae bacterium]